MATPPQQTDHDRETDEVIDGEVIEEEEAEVTPPSSTSTLPAVRASEAIVARAEISVDEVVAQREKVVQVMERVMKKDVHYGVIPGVKKPSLFKPGAETILVALRLAPHYDSEKLWHDDGHLTVVTKCVLKHIPTGLIIATGEGLCTTRESRYAYRKSGRTCPACDAEDTILRSKYPPRENDYPGANPSDPPGWYCFAKRGGCGANFAHDDESIVEQNTDQRIPNPDLADTYNTVLKMSDKRALVAAVLNGTAASDVFTQDVEDGTVPTPDDEPSSSDDVAFDPGSNLLANAVRGAGAAGRLRAMQQALAPDLDWGGMLAEASTSRWGPREQWTPEQLTEFRYRWSNAIARMHELAETSPSYGGPDLGLQAGEEGDAIIIEGFFFAFEYVLNPPLPKLESEQVDQPADATDAAQDATGEQSAELHEADEQIPFGDKEQS
jgi:hypothetical protein